MGSLTTCIRKAGAALHAEDKRAILEAAAAYRAEGMGATEAARRAVDKRIAAVRAQLEARVREVERGAADVETEAPTAPTPKPHLFKTRAAAVAAKTGNMQRLRKVAGGYILRDASEAEMAAAERNGRRLAGPRAVDLERDSLLVAIAKLGGLSMAERADTVGEGNKNVAGRMLFARGGSLIDEIAADLRTLGYVPQTEMDRDGGTTWLRDAIRAEFNGLRESYSEAGTGWLEDAERERESRMRDPFEDVLNDFTPDELDDAGYTYAPPAVRHDVDALLAEAAALGIDSAAAREEAARITEDQSEDAYYAEVQRITREAIEAARADTARVDSAGSRAGDADRGAAVGEEGGAQEGLTLEAQTAASLAAKTAREARAGELDERAQIDAERAGFGLTQQAAPETRRDTTGDIFGGPSAAELQAAAERERAKTATGPSGPDLFSEPAEDAAQPPAATETEEGEGRQERAGSAKPSGRIDDFGEKLEGARKDYAATLKDAQDMDVAAEPLSKSWPEPDYQKLLDGGADPRAVATIRALRDELPTKPQKAWKLRGWVDLVKGLRSSATIIVDGTVPAARATELLAKRGETGANIIGRAELYEAIGHDRSLRGVSLRRHHFSLYHGQENVSKWVVEQKAKATAFSNWPRELAVADTKDEALRIFKEKVGSLDLGTKAKGQPQFVIYRKRGQEGAFIGKKIGREFIDLHRAADVAAARAYMASNLADLERALALYRSTPFERRPDNRPRVGDDHRNGAPVTPEVFDETFGFRGVQFGNYVEQGRRQSDLNEAYDALMDMAAILGLPPRALSLNGQLGLAFGARGTGGKDAPGATYDPDFVVINLTKGGGPGALAHEWWHGVDNYFAKLGGANGSVTGGAQASAMREAMQRAFAAVKAATSTPAYKQRAIELDKRRSRPYWSAADERSARAFESYIIAKLQDQGASNDYLANVVSEQFWNASEALRAGLFSEGKQPDTYPYPLPAEMPAVRAAFDEFFKTVETRTDDTGNVAMFSRVPSSAAEVRAAREAIARIERAGGVTSPDDLAAVLRVSGYSQWAESPIAGDVDAAAALRADLDARFPRGDWKRPILNDQGVISVTGEWLRDTLLRDDPKAADDLAALADKHSAPIIVRGHLSSSVGEVASFLERFLRPAGFEDYAGHQEMDGRPDRVAITYIRPKGNISRVTPLYSRATPAGRMTHEAATDLAAAIAVTWANAPKVQVVRDMQDPAIPANVRAEDARQRRSGAIGQPNGFYYGGTVYVVSSQISSAQELATVLFHEALGHAGLRGVFGAALKHVLKQLAALNRPAVEAKAKQYGLDMGKEQDRLIAAEEVLTGLAQTRPESTWVQKAIAAIRGWLRENLPAIFSDMQMSDAELVQRFIVPARDFIERGRADAQGDVAPVFSRAEATPLWYSELASQVQAAAMKAAPASGWRAWLKGLPQKGVKPDEIEWSGLPEWLDLQDGKVTREQVAEYLRANGVQVTETVLGAPLSSSEAGLAARKAVFDEYAPRINPLHERAGDFRITPEERAAARAEAERLMEQRDAEADRAYRLPADETSPAKYDRYTLPGGESYREILLTLPDVPRNDKPQPLDALPAGYEAIFDSQEPQGQQWGVTEPGQMHARPWAGRHADPEAARAAALKKLNAERLSKWKDAAPDYRSGHWDTPNILAHIRVNDRMAPLHDMNEIGERIVKAIGAKSQQTIGSGAPGLAVRKGVITQDEADWYSHHRGFLTDTAKPAPMARVLFVEEIQSDWSAETRKQREAIAKAVDSDFNGIVDRMKQAGVLGVVCD